MQTVEGLAAGRAFEREAGQAFCGFAEAGRWSPDCLRRDKAEL